jgi:O-antigen/teichoic acid export membrane protein
MLRRFLLVLGGQALGGATLFVNSLLMARALGPSGRGMLALAVLIPTALLIVLNGGAHYGAVRFLARGEITTGDAAGALLLLTAGISFGVWAAAAVFWEFVRNVVYRGLPPVVVVLSLASLPLLLLVYYFEGVWVAAGEAGIALRVRTLQAIVNLVASVVAVMILDLGVPGAVTGFFLGGLAAAAMVLRGAHGLARSAWRFSWSTARRILRFGIEAHPGSLAEYALNRADSLLVGYLLDFRALGFYSVAVPAAELVWYASYAMRPVLFARTASEGTESSRLSAAVVRLTTGFAAVLGAAMMAASLVVVNLLLPAFQPALPVLAILVVAAVIAVVYQLLAAVVTSHGFGGSWSRRALIVLPLGLVAYIVLIRAFGIEGAAVGSLLAYGLESFLALHLFQKVCGLSPLEVLEPRRSDLDILRNALDRLRRTRSGRETDRAG